MVDKKFAEDRLAEMAGYRNRMIHFYDEITPKELYQIITRDLGDLETFARIAVEVVTDPGKIGLSTE